MSLDYISNKFLISAYNQTAFAHLLSDRNTSRSAEDPYNSSFHGVGVGVGFDAPLTTLELVAFISFASVCIVTTIVGNALVALSVFTYGPLRGVQNYFIVSLAGADLAVAVFVMPFNVASFATFEIDGGGTGGSVWIFGSVWCNVWLTLDILCCTASILHLCAIAIDRYHAIHDPINYAVQRTYRRVLVKIIVVWLLSAVISIPPLIGWNNSSSMSLYDERSRRCQLTDEPSYVVYSSAGSFYIPLLIMSFVYVQIYRATRARLRARMKTTTALGSTGGGRKFRFMSTAQSSAFIGTTCGTTGGSATAGGRAGEEACGDDVENEDCEIRSPLEIEGAAMLAIEDARSSYYDGGVFCGEQCSSFGGRLDSSGAGGDRIMGSGGGCGYEGDNRPNSAAWSADGGSSAGGGANGGSATIVLRQPNDNGDSRCGGAVTFSVNVGDEVIIKIPQLLDTNRLSVIVERKHGVGAIRQCKSLSESNRRDRECGRNRPPQAPQQPLNDLAKLKQRISLTKERRAARTMGIIMGAFVVCWLPFFLMYVVFPFCSTCSAMADRRLVNFIVWLGYLNSALNPIIYTVFNIDFRRAFQNILCGRYCSQTTRQY